MPSTKPNNAAVPNHNQFCFVGNANISVKPILFTKKSIGKISIKPNTVSSRTIKSKEVCFAAKPKLYIPIINKKTTPNAARYPIGCSKYFGMLWLALKIRAKKSKDGQLKF